MTGIEDIRRTRDLPPEAGHVHTDHWYGGDWRVVDHGFLRYSSGKVLSKKSISSDVTTNDLYLVNMDGTWDMRLFQYEDIGGVNDEGEGVVIQPWVMGFDPGKVSWSAVE